MDREEASEVVGIPGTNRRAAGPQRLVLHAEREHAAGREQSEQAGQPRREGPARQVAEQAENFLIIGQRWDMDIRELLDFSEGWDDRLRARIKTEGKLHPPVGSDYFIYPSHCFTQVPDFAVGRSMWDNWMIYHALKSKWATVDATGAATVGVAAVATAAPHGAPVSATASAARASDCRPRAAMWRCMRFPASGLQGASRHAHGIVDELLHRRPFVLQEAGLGGGDLDHAEHERPQREGRHERVGSIGPDRTVGHATVERIDHDLVAAMPRRHAGCFGRHGVRGTLETDLGGGADERGKHQREVVSSDAQRPQPPALGFHPLATRDQMPWMPKGRYAIMRQYMPRVGHMGLDMMLRTCTVQVNLDFGDEADMVEKLAAEL